MFRVGLRVAAGLAVAGILTFGASSPGNANNWDGPYLGITMGGAYGDYTLFSPSGLGPDVDVDDIVGGATIGINLSAGSGFLLGIEADISSGPDGVTSQGTAGPFWSCNSGACNADIEYFGTVRARLGFTSGNMLIFATGGYAYGDVEGGILNSAQQGSGSASGWAAGLGIEGAWSQLSLKLEYLHVDLGDIPFGRGIGTEPFEGDGDFDVIRIGINVHPTWP